MITERARRRLAREALAGYVHGPGATVEATERALRQVLDSDVEQVILVEGVSDQIAVETTAVRCERDLDLEGRVVVPVGGAHAVARFVGEFADSFGLSVVCDDAEADVVRRHLMPIGVPVHVCVADLEDELIRAAGVDLVQAVLEDQGDRGSFRTLQKQPPWRNQPIDAQLRRFFGAGARRKLRYARRLVEAIPIERLPSPLVAALGPV